MPIQFIPFGLQQDSYIYRHLLDKTKVPKSKNAMFRPGCVEKRPGRTTVYDFLTKAAGTEILGYIDVNMDSSNSGLEPMALIFTGIPGSAVTLRTGKVYEWNYITDSTATEFHLVDITPAGGLHNTAKWECINHWDQTLNEHQTICSNGIDHIMKYVQTGGAGDTIGPPLVHGAQGVMSTLVNATDINNGLYFKGLYLASYGNSVFVANITDDGDLTLEFSYGGTTNIVSNGTFDTDTADWSATGGTIASVAGGISGKCLELTETGGSAAYATQTISGLVVGRIYELTIWVKSGSAGAQTFEAGMYDTDTSAWLEKMTGTSSGTWTQYRAEFTAVATSDQFRISVGDINNTMLFDEVAVCVQISDGDTVTGAESGAFATVDGSITVSSGTFADGDAAGSFAFINKNLNFIPGEALSITYGSTTVTDICLTDDGTQGDSFGYVWSLQGDSHDFSDPDAYERIPDDGLPINGLKKYANPQYGDQGVLMLSRGGNNYLNNQLWQIWNYDNFRCLFPARGASNHTGMVATAKTFYYNDKGKFYDLGGNDISQSIEIQMKSESPGTWDFVAIDRNYNDEIWLSCGKKMFVYSEKQQTWQIMDFGRDVRLLSALKPGMAAKSMVSPTTDPTGVSRHTAMSVAEEDTISNIVFSYGGSELCITNPFCDDNDIGIDFMVESPTVPLGGDGSTRGIVREIRLMAEKNEGSNEQDDYTLSACVGSSPVKNPEWTAVGTLTVDDEGEARITPLNMRGVWGTFKVENSSRKLVRLYGLNVKAEPDTDVG